MIKDIFYFEKMLIPRIITFLYWLLLFSAVIGGITSMFGGYAGFTFGKFLLWIIYLIAGSFFARVFCELLIVMFKMNEALQD